MARAYHRLRNGVTARNTKTNTDLPSVRAWLGKLLDDAAGDPQLIWTDQIDSREQRHFMCLLSGDSSAYRRVHYGSFTDPNV